MPGRRGRGKSRDNPEASWSEHLRTGQGTPGPGTYPRDSKTNLGKRSRYGEWWQEWDHRGLKSMAATVDRAQATEALQKQPVSRWREASGQAGRQDSSEKSAVRERLRGSWGRIGSQTQVCSRWKRLEMEGNGQVRRTRADQVHSPISNPLCEQVPFTLKLTVLNCTSQKNTGVCPQFREPVSDWSQHFSAERSWRTPRA